MNPLRTEAEEKEQADWQTGRDQQGSEIWSHSHVLPPARLPGISTDAGMGLCVLMLLLSSAYRGRLRRCQVCLRTGHSTFPTVRQNPHS